MSRRLDFVVVVGCRMIRHYFPYLLLLLLLGLWVVVGGMAITGPDYSPAIEHPQHPEMLQAGERLGVDANHPYVGAAMASFIVLIFCLLAARGTAKEAGTAPLSLLLLLVAVLFVVSVTAMVFAVGPYADDPQIVGVAPLPTMIMFACVWGTPVGLVVLYVVGFKSWVYPERRRKKYEQILAKNAVQKSGEGIAS